MFYDFPDMVSRKKYIFILIDHSYKSFNLLFIFFSDILIAFQFEVKAFCLVHPVDAFSPGKVVA